MTRLQIPRDVALCVVDDVTYVASLPDGPIVVLDGIAHVIWDEALHGPRASLAARIAEATGAAEPEVDAVVTGFVGSLIDRGLLHEVDG